VRAARHQKAQAAPVVNVTVEPARLPGAIEVRSAPRDYRRELWIGVAIATVGSDNCTKPTSAELFADAALAAYDARFPGG